MIKAVHSPCIGVCSYRRRGHCVGCSMTKAQRRLFFGLKHPSQRQAFIDMLLEQQQTLGRYEHWLVAYRQKSALLDEQGPE